MRAPEQIQTERLLLRRPRERDAPALFSPYGADAQVTRFLTWQPKERPERMAEFLRSVADDWEAGTTFHWALVPSDGTDPVGMISAEVDGHRVELGYVLAASHQGRRLMSEAVAAVTEWALAQDEIHRVWATCDVENVASAGVLQTCGFEREGVLRRWAVHPNISPAPRDSYAFARVRE